MMNLRFYREVDKLQDNRDFSPDFKTDLLINLISEPAQTDSDTRLVLLNRLEAELRYINRKSVYVAMKWLIFIHKIIQKTTSPNTLESINYLLHQMTSPFTPEKIDEYVSKKLVIPYKKYLMKLVYQGQHRNEEGQNLKTKVADYYAYSQFNFINTALTDLTAPIREFTSFFAQEYPYLNTYIDLINSNLTPLYQQVLHAFEENAIGKVSFIEVEKMGSQMILFGYGRENKKHLQATADNSHSANQNRPQPANHSQITPFPNLQCSNLSLNFPHH